MARFNLDDLPFEQHAIPVDLGSVDLSVGTDTLALVSGGWGDGSQILQGEEANNTTKTVAGQCSVRLPQGYAYPAGISAAAGEVAADANLTVRVSARLTAAPGTSGNLDLEAYVSDEEGGVGSDLCATSVADLTAGGTSFDDYDFTITGTTLLEGSLLNFVLRSVVNDSGGSGCRVEIGSIKVLVNVRG